MIGLDSNVLLRAVLNDDTVWSAAANKFIDTECTPNRPGFLNVVVLAEIVWVLRRLPDYDRAKLATFVEGLLEADNLVVDRSQSVERALAAFKSGSAGFADYLIAELNAEAGATPTVTIDKHATRNDAFKALKPVK